MISWVGSWFSGLTILYLITLVAFVWPRLYEEKHAEIDHFVQVASTKAAEQVGQVAQKLPPAVREKVAPFLPAAQPAGGVPATSTAQKTKKQE